MRYAPNEPVAFLSIARVIWRGSSLIFATRVPSAAFQIIGRLPFARFAADAPRTRSNRSSEDFSAKPLSAIRALASPRATALSKRAASSIHRSRPALGAAPIASITSRGILTAEEISRDSPVLSTDKAAMMVSRAYPLSSSRAANKAFSMKERSVRALFSWPWATTSCWSVSGLTIARTRSPSSATARRRRRP